MRVRNEESYRRKKEELMEACFAAYARGGLSSTGIKALAGECGCSSATLYTYFDNLDDPIVQSTAHCMAKAEGYLKAQLDVLKTGIALFMEQAKTV